MDSHSVVGLLDAESGALRTNLVHHAQLSFRGSCVDLKLVLARFGWIYLDLLLFFFAFPMFFVQSQDLASSLSWLKRRRYYVCTAATWTEPAGCPYHV